MRKVEHGGVVRYWIRASREAEFAALGDRRMIIL